MINKNIKTILWDLDGTIIDSFGILRDLLAEILPRHGLAVLTDEVLMRNFHGSLQETIASCLELDHDDETVVAIKNEFIDIQNKHYEVIDQHLFQDALRFMSKAHDAGLNQIIVSNRLHVGHLNASPRNIVKRSELEKYINIVVCGDDSEHRKPNPLVIDDLLHSKLVDPSETVVIGDQFVDGQFAKNLGCNAILVNRHGDIAHLDRLGPDWEEHIQLVSSLDEVKLG